MSGAVSREAIPEAAMMARNRWLLALVEETGADPEALAKTRMGGFGRTFDGSWALYVANGTRFLMTPRLWQELYRWRDAIGLSEMPAYGEDTPLLQISLHDPRPLAPGEATAILKRLRKSADLAPSR